MRDVVERHDLNGHMLKAYTGLLKKGEKANAQKIPKNNQNKVDLDGFYDYIYLEKKGKIPEKNSHPWIAKD